MAFCIRCGSPLQDGSRFCAACGAPQETPQATPQSNPYNNSYTENSYPQGIQTSAAGTRLRMFLLQNNTLMYSLIILLAINAFLNLLGILITSNKASDFVSAILSLTLPVITICALEMIQTQCKKNGFFPTAGFTTLQVVSIIQAVCLFILALLCLFLAFDSSFLLSILRINLRGMGALLVFVIILLMSIFVLMGILYVIIAISCTKMKQYLRFGTLPRLSGFAMGCLWTFGVLCAISAVGELANMGNHPGQAVLAFFSSGCLAGTQIVGAIILTKAKQAFSF